jgi:hypothetical protein
MKIIAIDPGNELSAWCALRHRLPCGSDKVDNPTLLGVLRDEDVWNPSADRLAIEMIASYGMPVGREVFETCLWIGRFMEAWERRGGKVQLVYRRDVKLFHCESVRATDANIRASIIDRFGPGKAKAIGTKAARGPLYGMKGDQWAALAVALKVAALENPEEMKA